MKRLFTLMFALVLFSGVFTVRAAEIDTGQRVKKENHKEFVSDVTVTVTSAETAAINAYLARPQKMSEATKRKSVIYSKFTTAGATEAINQEIRPKDPGWRLKENAKNIKRNLPAGRQ